MPTFSELIDSFVSSHRDKDRGGEVEESNAGYRVEGHELREVIEGTDRGVAGWQDPGTIDAMLWISSSWSGWARTNLELKLRKVPMVCYTIMPTDDFDDLGADVIWWGYAIECMSCSEVLADEQRRTGLCNACVELRANHLGVPESESTGGIEQRRGLHGAPLPRTRPNNG